MLSVVYLSWRSFICHQVFETEGGVKVVTRIWYGWTVRYGLSYKALPDGFRMQASPIIPLDLDNF